MQATLAQLQERGAVEQRNEARRGLRAQLRVTPAGQDLLQLGTAAMQTIEQQLLAPLPVEHQRVLGPALMTVLTGMLGEDASVRRSEGSAAGAGPPEGRSTGE
jgi:DNA-binding MarR family transcriptional regulator